MTKLTDEDLRHVVGRLPNDVRNMLKLNPQLFLAGGYIRAIVAGEEPKDIDLFGPSVKVLKAEATKLHKERMEKNASTRLLFTKNAISILDGVRLPVQYITRWIYADATTLLESFDFTVCQAVIWFGSSGWDSVCSDRFYSDLAAKRLVYTSPVREEAAGGSIMRVGKYIKRGYNIQPPSLAAVVVRLTDAVRDSGVDRVTVVTELLREVDPLLAFDDVADLPNMAEIAWAKC